MGFFEDLFGSFFSSVFEIENVSYNAYIEKVKSIEDEMASFLKKMDGYIYFSSYKDLLNKARTVHAETSQGFRFNRLIRSAIFKRLSREYSSLKRSIVEFQRGIDEHNNTILKAAVDDAYVRIGKVEGQYLDFQQMACIVKEAHNHLIIAGAGTGKTTTIIGKVKSLVLNNQCTPADILVLSFAHDTAAEMKKRLSDETGHEFNVCTFHKLGYDIIRKMDHISPRVFTGNKHQLILDYINSHLADKDFEKLVITYLLYHKVVQRSEFDFDSEQGYYVYLEANPPTTIREEVVKSYGEMEIANFLSQNGIQYIYESEYVVDTRDEENAQYHPDFFLPEYRIYIEYYGINRDGEVPGFFSGKRGKTAAQAYQDGIQWKRRTHKNNGTILVEAYAYEKQEGTLLSNLRRKLASHGVTFREVPLESILEEAGQKSKDVMNVLADVVSTVISLARSRRLSSDDIIKMCNAESLISDQLTLARIVKPVMDDYLEFLHSNNSIDFTDMLTRAEDLVNAGIYHHPFKYIIVDEYQDISSSQYRLLKALREQRDYELFCVGDDWQSIYRFAGSDIGYILNYSDYWGDSEISRIETTYRFSQRLIDISSNFIMENPNQIVKQMNSGCNTEKYVLGEIHGYTQESAVRFMVERLRELPKGVSVFFIGRYNFDIELLRHDPRLSIRYDNKTQSAKITLSIRPDLNMAFYTAHRSKGLQADYVFVINTRDTHMGFPSRTDNPPLIEALLEHADNYDFAEERRLFYVTITRARKKVFLVTAGNNLSPFVKELKDQYGTEIKEEAWICPQCGGKLTVKDGKYGRFIGCNNYADGCRFTRTITQKKSSEMRGLDNDIL